MPSLSRRSRLHAGIKGTERGLTQVPAFGLWGPVEARGGSLPPTRQTHIGTIQKPGMDLADTYIMFVRQNQDILREKVNEEMYIEKLFDQWYSSSMKVICMWLADRLDLQLHIYQLKTLIKIVKKTYRDFRLQGVLEGTLNSKTYDTVHSRLTVEEATVSVTDAGGLQGITMKDSDEEEG
ncbi:PREDICTED: calcium-dependent secretion activator 2-like [Tauraco erythrolophus]|uniref:calcium-dependent secretion activator 2-like n=1 Tax=Tauraco erythrolophus TaxID=121530 RepID=UPI0005239EBE|nr:PREDICTED: calcium-dependent secretion activator 2-like [Tauraco erythrolophus]